MSTNTRSENQPRVSIVETGGGRRVRVWPTLRCACGHVFVAVDLEVDSVSVRLGCPDCHRSALDIDLR